MDSDDSRGNGKTPKEEIRGRKTGQLRNVVLLPRLSLSSVDDDQKQQLLRSEQRQPTFSFKPTLVVPQLTLTIVMTALALPPNKLL